MCGSLDVNAKGKKKRKKQAKSQARTEFKDVQTVINLNHTIYEAHKETRTRRTQDNMT